MRCVLIEVSYGKGEGVYCTVCTLIILKSVLKCFSKFRATVLMLYVFC